MAYSKVKSDIGAIAIPKSFIDKYLCSADGSFVKVYLLGLSQCETDKHMPPAEFAKHLSMLLSDVIRAWEYWESQGLVKITYKNKDKTDFDIEFQDSTMKCELKLETKPAYTANEIYSCAEKNPQIKELFNAAAKILDKQLSSADINVIYSLYDFYCLPADVISMLISYCANSGKKSMRQIEKMAQVWQDKGINTLESAEKYIAMMEKYSSKVHKLKNALGIYDRNFTPTEEKYIKTWFEQMNLSVELIAFAYDIAVVNSGKINFKYMNTILTDWYVNGIKTPKQANEYKNSRKPAQRTNSKKVIYEFEKEEFDYAAIEARALGKK
ncbi:MAG: DnaD domain protein [Clostridia bacterium]|nr:DnaD domain protein [Clostridia bacterium]